MGKVDDAKEAAKAERASVNEAQAKGNEAAMKKAEGMAKGEIANFFDAADALEAEAKAAFEKYDADKSGFIDSKEIAAVLEDMDFFAGTEEGEKQSLIDSAFAGADTNSDNQLDFPEFTVLYNQLVAQKEAGEAKGVKVPSIFGDALTDEEKARVKAMKPMLDRSVFAGRLKETPSKAYFDEVKLRDKMFKLDWGRIDKKPSFLAFKERAGLAIKDKQTGKVKAQPLAKHFKKVMREEYDVLCNAFTYYTCRDVGAAMHAMDFSEFELFTHACGLRQCKSEKDKKFGFCDLKAMFAELNEEDPNANKKKQKENLANDDDAFLRFEFLELVMRQATQFPQTSDTKAAFSGYMIFARNNILRECKVAAQDRNLFRKDRLYTQPVMDLFKKYTKELRMIYTLNVGLDFKDMTIKEWIWFSKRVDLMDKHIKEGEGLSEADLLLFFTQSQMMVADEIKDREAYASLSFIEFMEALGRVADVKDIPTKNDLVATGLKSTVAAIENNEALREKKKPQAIPRRPSSDLMSCPPKSGGLEERLELLFDYVFQMLSPDCGSILMGTYNQGKFVEDMSAECKDLYGKVLWEQ